MRPGIRPLRPDDAGRLQAFVRALSPQARYLRFHTGLNELSPALLAAMTRLDARRQRAHVAVALGDGGEIIVGDARYGAAQDDPASAEIGIVVAEAWRRIGVGSALLHALLDDARAAGIATVYGEVLAENLATLSFARNAGFSLRPDTDDRRLMRIEAALPLRSMETARDAGRPVQDQRPPIQM